MNIVCRASPIMVKTEALFIPVSIVGVVDSNWLLEVFANYPDVQEKYRAKIANATMDSHLDISDYQLDISKIGGVNEYIKVDIGEGMVQDIVLMFCLSPVGSMSDMINKCILDVANKDYKSATIYKSGISLEMIDVLDSKLHDCQLDICID